MDGGLQLDIVELVAEDIGQDDDGVLCAFVLGVADVALDCELWSATILIAKLEVREEEEVDEEVCNRTNVPPPIVFSSPVGVPSCLTPTVQQRPIGLEAIV